jgi:DNA-binding MarR family transcriptional regulator
MHTRDVNVIGAWVLQMADSVLSNIEESGLAAREAAALVLVSTHPGCGIEWLTARLGLTQSGTVRLVDRLVSQQWLVRAEGSTRRSVRLQVTEPGQRRIDEVLGERGQTLARLLAPLTDEELQVLAGLADRLLKQSGRDRCAADRACRLCDWPSCEPECPVNQSVTGGRAG